VSADYNIIIIGAGVVGLAAARAIAEKGETSVLIIEKEDGFGHGISSRNSEVIHSGIYYNQGSIKAAYCSRANKRLYQFCDKENVWYNNCGKLVIAQQGQDPALQDLYQQGILNGVDGIRLINKNEIASLEPNIAAETALFIPSTGIISANELMSAFYRISASREHDTLFMSSVKNVGKTESGAYEITIIEHGSAESSVTANWVINAAGLHSDAIAELVMGNTAPSLKFSKGEYFKLSSQWANKFSHLVYPLPDIKHDTLGIHLSIDQSGFAKLGPSAAWLDSLNENYSVDEDLKSVFYDEAKKYIPDLDIDDLSADYSGIRPKYFVNNDQQSDYYIKHEKDAGLAGWINLVGIDSPGLTAAISIGEDVAEWITN